MSGYYILMPAYKASKTLQQTIEKIPKEIYSLIKEIVIVEDINNIQEQYLLLEV